MKCRIQFDKLNEEFIELHLVIFKHRFIVCNHCHDLAMHEIVICYAVFQHHVSNVLSNSDKLKLREDYVELLLQLNHEIHNVIHLKQNYYFESIIRPSLSIRHSSIDIF